MVDLINNQSKLLGDDLKTEIKNGSKIKVAASYFSIYAYDALKQELEGVKEMEFVFTSPTFIKDKVSENSKKESREFFIPKQLRENSLYGSDFEIRLRNQLTQKAIARECADWIRKKVKFKSVTSSATMPNFLSIERQNEDAITYSPVNAFTTVELGYEKSDTFFTGIMKNDIPLQSNFFISQFEQVWNDNSLLDDVTQSIVDFVETCYKENSPEYIYFIILYNIFKEFLTDLYEDYMPNEATGYKDSLVWKKLYNFQRDGAVGIINKLEKYNGCILADSVGLGKTFTALAVMEYYSLRNKSILVLCPKRLSSNWNAYRGNTKTNIFYQDRIRYDVLYHTDLGRTSGFSNGMNLSTINWGNYDLVVIDETNRESGIQRLMTINLLKRLESSVYAFNITLKNIIETNNCVLDTIRKFQQGDQTLTVEKEYFEYDTADLDEDDSFSLVKVSSGKKINVALKDIDVVTWKREIEEDVATLRSIQNETMKVTPDDDFKLSTLKSLIDKKIAIPINEGNKKFLIFSAFADTTDYLYENISAYVLVKYGLHTAKVVGGNTRNECNDGGSNDTDRILTFFSPLSKEKDLLYKDEQGGIDVLIGTDCISEGQNLQDCDICINYDIHWNPVRIVQRFGRIDRIGSKNKYIQLVSFWPDISLDEYINLQKRVSARMTIVNATATADDNILNDQEEMDYRAVQLKKLKDGELQELEDVDGSITITDLGLNEFRMDMVSYLKKFGEPKCAATGLNAVVKADLSKGIVPGVIYVLRNRNDGVNIDKQNRLHPYYLVYLKDNGEVVYNHLQVKNILDVIRTTCKFKEEPVGDVCKAFNKETKDGYKMDKYSRLLEDAIETIINVKEEKDLQSLFQSGSSVLFQTGIKGLEDFELIAFVVIK